MPIEAVTWCSVSSMRTGSRRARSTRRDVERGGRVGDLVGQDDELVAAEAGDGVGRADRLLEPRGERAQEGVAGVVAERVVDDLEAVEVEQQHRRRMAAAAGAHERVREPVEEERAVRQARQLVVQRAAMGGGLGADALERGGEHGRHHGEELQVLGRPGARVGGEHGDDAERLARAAQRAAQRTGDALAREQGRAVQARVRADVVDGDGLALEERLRGEGPLAELDDEPRGEDRPREGRGDDLEHARRGQLAHGDGAGAEALRHDLRGPGRQLGRVGELDSEAAQVGAGIAQASAAGEGRCGLAALLVGAPASGDVLDLDLRIEDATAGVAHGGAVHATPDHLSVRAAVALLDHVVARGREAVQRGDDILGIRPLHRRGARQHRARTPEEATQRVVDLHDAVVDAQQRHRDGAVLERAAVALVDLPQADGHPPHRVADGEDGRHHGGPRSGVCDGPGSRDRGERRGVGDGEEADLEQRVRQPEEHEDHRRRPDEVQRRRRHRGAPEVGADGDRRRHAEHQQRHPARRHAVRPREEPADQCGDGQARDRAGLVGRGVVRSEEPHHEDDRGGQHEHAERARQRDALALRATSCWGSSSRSRACMAQ